MSNNRTRNWILTAAAATGVILGAAGVAGAASTQSSTTTPTAATATAPAAPQDPAKLANGPGETLLTGTTADQVKAAALAAVPGATIIRVETDSAGSPYEAHVTKSDGSQVTVKVGSDFKVTSTEDGFGRGPKGQAPPAGSSSNSGSSSSSSTDNSTGTTAGN